MWTICEIWAFNLQLIWGILRILFILFLNLQKTQKSNHCFQVSKPLPQAKKTNTHTHTKSQQQTSAIETSARFASFPGYTNLRSFWMDFFSPFIFHFSSLLARTLPECLLCNGAPLFPAAEIRGPAFGTQRKQQCWPPVQRWWGSWKGPCDTVLILVKQKLVLELLGSIVSNLHKLAIYVHTYQLLCRHWFSNTCKTVTSVYKYTGLHWV